MEKLLISLGLIILITILFIVILDYRLFRQISRSKRNQNQNLIDDEKYHELNYKIRTVITSATIFIVIGGYLGYSSISSIRKESDDLLIKYKTSLIDYESTILKYKALV